MRVLPRRFQVTLFERDGDVLREPDADEAAGGDGVAVANQRDGFARGDDLAVLERVQRFEQLPLVGRAHGSRRKPWSNPASPDAMLDIAIFPRSAMLSFLCRRS